VNTSEAGVGQPSDCRRPARRQLSGCPPGGRIMATARSCLGTRFLP
jgi:hypothetical protein